MVLTELSPNKMNNTSNNKNFSQEKLDWNIIQVKCLKINLVMIFMKVG